MKVTKANLSIYNSFIDIIFIEDRYYYINSKTKKRIKSVEYKYITEILSRQDLQGKIITRNYFMSLKDDYYRITGRKINKTKLAHVLKILDIYGIIKRERKIYRSKEGQIKDESKYYIGKNNPNYIVEGKIMSSKNSEAYDEIFGEEKKIKLEKEDKIREIIKKAVEEGNKMRDEQIQKLINEIEKRNNDGEEWKNV